MNTQSGTDVPTLPGELTATRLFSGRLALPELLLFSLFITDILTLGLVCALTL